MSEMTVVTLLVEQLLVVVAALTGMWLWGRRAEVHLLHVLDRFLSRNMSEFGMTDLMNKEITADQQEDDDPEADEDAAFETYMANRLEAERAVGGKVS